MTGFNGTPSKRILDAFGLEQDATGALVPKVEASGVRVADIEGRPDGTCLVSIPAIDAECSVLPPEIAAGFRSFFATLPDDKPSIKIDINSFDVASWTAFFRDSQYIASLRAALKSRSQK